MSDPTDPEVMKMLLMRLCVEAGVQIHFETFVSNPVVENGVVTGVIIEGKGGRKFVGAKVLVDCSADAEMAAKPDAPFAWGRARKRRRCSRYLCTSS